MFYYHAWGKLMPELIPLFSTWWFLASGTPTAAPGQSRSQIQKCSWIQFPDRSSTVPHCCLRSTGGDVVFIRQPYATVWGNTQYLEVTIDFHYGQRGFLWWQPGTLFYIGYTIDHAGDERSSAVYSSWFPTLFTLYKGGLYTVVL